MRQKDEMSDEARVLLMPRAVQYAEAVSGGIWDMEIDELATLRRACREPSQTNCPWPVYWVAEAMRPEIEHRYKYLIAEPNWPWRYMSVG